MQKDQQKLAQLIQGKKVAFIGAGVSHKTLIKEFVELGAHVTLCDQKKSVEDFGDYAATIRELGIDLSLGENYMDGFKGQDIIMRTPGFEYFTPALQQAIAAGIGLVPEDRRRQGVILDDSVRHNISIVSLRDYAKRGQIDFGWERDTATAYIEKLRAAYCAIL